MNFYLRKTTRTTCIIILIVVAYSSIIMVNMLPVQLPQPTLPMLPSISRKQGIGGLKPVAKGSNRVVLVPSVDVPENETQIQIPGNGAQTNRSITHIKASLLTVIGAVLLSSRLCHRFSPLRTWLDGAKCEYLFCFVAILYLLEASCSSTRTYLSNILEPNDLRDMMGKLRAAQPVIKWHVECYHYRTVCHRRDGKVSTARQKVVTHFATQTYLYRR